MSSPFQLTKVWNQTGFYGKNGGYSEFFMGQSLNLTNEKYPIGSGADKSYSDYVGRITIQPHDYFNLENRFRIDKKSLGMQRNETVARTGPEWLRLSLNYASITKQSNLSSQNDREQITVQGRWRLTDYWTTSASNARDLTGDGGNLYWTWNVGYSDECFEFTLQSKRSYQRDRDVNPSTSIGFFIKLKTLGL